MPFFYYLITLIDMAFIHNITFVVDPSRESDVLGWLRKSALPALFGGEGQARCPRLLRLVEAGGAKPAPEHGLSVALQAEFPSSEAVGKWCGDMLHPVLADFHEKFGPHSAFFTTTLETVEL